VWVGESSYTDPMDLRDAIARLATEAPHACRRLHVTIDRPPVQLRTITDLPPVKPQHLPALVAQQGRRFFRRNGQPLVTDAAWQGGSARGVARAAAVEEALVEAIAVGARAAGLRLDAIVPADDRAMLSLLPPSERARRARAGRRWTRVLTLVAAATWLTSGAVFVAKLAWERQRVERDLGALEEPLAAVLRARRELRDAEAALNAVRASGRQRGQALAVLTAVTGALPDSSVLTSLSWSGDGTGMLAGAARRGMDVVARVAAISGLPGVRLGGPLIREPMAGREWERLTVLFGGQRRKGEREGS
jgi:Tfp pilus assembly protein PilN